MKGTRTNADADRPSRSLGVSRTNRGYEFKNEHQPHAQHAEGSRRPSVLGTVEHQIRFALPERPKGSTWTNQVHTAIAAALEAGSVLRCSTAFSAAASMTLIITGVGSTAMRPEPTKEAVCSGLTKSCAVPVRPEVMEVRFRWFVRDAKYSR